MTFEELFADELAPALPDATVGELMREYDAQDIDFGFWTFHGDDDDINMPFSIEAVNRESMRQGKIAALVKSDIDSIIEEQNDHIPTAIY